MLKPLAVLVAAAVAVVALASPAEAATATRPVTLAASGTCVQYQWTVAITVTSVKLRTVDLYDDSDYGARPIVDLAGVTQLGIKLQPGTAYRLTYHPGASAQYAEIGVFSAGSGGWDGDADPLAWTTVRDPIQTNPHATC